MEHITDLLRSDIHKFKDIFNIMLKLDEDGAVKEICDLFYKIFSSESKFTLGELTRIQKERPEKINISKQYENNLSLFKSNFSLIVQLIADNTFKVVTKETHDKLREKSSIKINDSEAEVPTRGESIAFEETPKKKKPDSSKLKLNLSNSSKKSIGTEPPKSSRREGTQSGSKAQSAFQNIINGGGSQCKTSRESFSTKDNDKDLSLSKSQTYSLSKRNSMQVSPNKSPRLDVGRTPVNSEFNYVQGSATFSQSQRKFMDINLNGPGPAFYDVEKASPSTVKRSSSPTIGKAQKQTWVDIMTKTSSPGPGGLYPSMHYVAK